MVVRSSALPRAPHILFSATPARPGPGQAWTEACQVHRHPLDPCRLRPLRMGQPARTARHPSPLIAASADAAAAAAFAAAGCGQAHGEVERPPA